MALGLNPAGGVPPLFVNFQLNEVQFLAHLSRFAGSVIAPIESCIVLGFRAGCSAICTGRIDKEAHDPVPSTYNTLIGNPSEEKNPAA
jgi:hypothetical protein